MEMLLVRPRDPSPGTSFTRIRTLTLPSVAAELAPLAAVSVVDESVTPLPDRPFDLVGITVDTPRAPRAYALADELRLRGQPVILGGTHPSAVPDEALEHADSVVVGEVEGLGARIVADLAAGRLAPRYRLDSPPDLGRVAVAEVDVLPRYRQHFMPYPIELSRGCRHACRFCFNRRIHGRGFRRRNLDDLVAAIRARGERLLVAMDDNLMNDPDHLGAFAEKLAPLRCRWGGQATVEVGDDPALLRVLRDSGFSYTFIGLESFSTTSLEGEGKRVNDVARYREQLRRLREHGVLPFAGVIVGLDGDGPDVFARTAAALEEVAPAACAFTMPVAFPGTRWYSKLEAEGRILDHDPTHYDGHHVVVRPARMSVEELVRGYHRLARRFYSWGPALRRMLRQKLWRQSFGPLQAAAGYTAVSAGYRRFHRRLRRRG